MATNTLEGADGRAMSGKNAYLPGSQTIACNVSWTPSGMLPVWMTRRPSQIPSGAVDTALMTVEALALARRYHELELPIIITAGTDDMHVATKLHPERLHRHTAHGGLGLAPGIGHMIHHVAPGPVLKAIDMATEYIS